jgi:hypothetical protein
LLIKHGIGIKKRAIELYELDEEYFSTTEEQTEVEKTFDEELG